MKQVGIIGCGPAGISAAIYLKRAGLDIDVYEKKEIGGLLLNANLVENYPGFPNGIPGSELVSLFKNQLHDLGVKVILKTVRDIEVGGDIFYITGDDFKEEYRTVILATGTRPKKLGIDGEEELAGKSLFYEVKELPDDLSGKSIAVIGGGDASFDYALNLANRGVKKIQIIFRGGHAKCLPILRERASEIQNIEVRNFTSPVSIEEKVDGVEVKCTSKAGDGEKVFHSDFVLAAVGREPVLDLLPEDLKSDSNVNDREMKVKGLYIAGDVRRGDFRQVGIAVGDGITAAMSVEKRLKGDGQNG